MAPHRPLPVLALVRDTYSEVWRLRGYWPRLIAVPTLLAAALVLLEWGTTGFILAIEGEPFGSLAGVSVPAITIIPVMVAWHRLAVLGTGAVGPMAPFTWTLRETRFMLYTLLVLVVAVLVLAAAFALSIGVGTAAIACCGDALLADKAFPVVYRYFATTFSGLNLVLLIVLAPVFARVFLVFPATALGVRAGLAGAWRVTRGHALRFAAVLVLAVYWPLAVLGVAMVVRPLAPSGAEIAGFDIFAAFVILIDAALCGVLYARVYRHVTGWDGAGTPPALDRPPAGSAAATADP